MGEFVRDASGVRHVGFTWLTYTHVITRYTYFIVPFEPKKAAP